MIRKKRGEQNLFFYKIRNEIFLLIRIELKIENEIIKAQITDQVNLFKQFS